MVRLLQLRLRGRQELRVRDIPTVLGHRERGRGILWTRSLCVGTNLAEQAVETLLSLTTADRTKGSFTLTGADTADLKGCVLSVLCKSQTRLPLFIR
jgi:hypothetical protein